MNIYNTNSQNWIAAQDPLQLAMIVIALCISILLIVILLKLRKGSNTSELGRIAASLADRETQLGEASTRADRAEALLSERRSDADKLALEVSDLQDKLYAGQALMSEQNAKIAGLETQAKADQAKTLEREQTIETAQRNVESLSERLESAKAIQATQGEEIAQLRKQIETDAQLLQDRKERLEKAETEIQTLRERIETEQKGHQALKARISALETQIEAERQSADEKIALLTKIRDDMQERFRQLADEALKSQGEAFSRSNVEKLEATLLPLKEHVGHFEKELREVHQETVKDRERLKAEITQLTMRSEAISQEALALTKALKGDNQQQGAWGEMILESILERSGLRAGEEYQTQAHRTGSEGERLRPDVVVMIPGGKSLVIDSKVSLNDYSTAVNDDDETVCAFARKRHVAAMRAHITNLSAKGYQLAEGQTVDYVIMFVPIEGALSEALREDGKLTEFALERNIMIATPTTLMMAMRTISNVWSVERRNQNAEDIAKRAGLLYDKVANFITSMEKVGKGIDNAHSAYENAIGQLSRGRGNMLSQVEMLRSLGARASKVIALDFDGKAEAQQLSTEDDKAEINQPA